MNRRTTITLLAMVASAAALWSSASLLGSTSVTQPRPPAPGRYHEPGAGGSAPHVPSEGPRHPMGTRLEYFAQTATDMSLGDTEDASSLVVSVEGSLAITTVGEDADGRGSYLRFQLSEPSIALGSGAEPVAQQARAAHEQLRDALRRRFYGLRAPDGHLAELYMFADREPHADGFLRTLAGASQFVRPDHRAPVWTTLEQDGTGEYVARYQRRDDGRYLRTKEPYTRLADERGLVPTAQVGALSLDSQTWFTFRPDALLESVLMEERLAITMAGSMAARTHAHTQLELTGTGFDDNAAAQWEADRALLETSALAHVSVGAGDATARHREILGDATWDDLAHALHELDIESGDGGRTLLARLTALFVLQPETAARAHDLVRAEPDGERVSVLLGALASADTPESQHAIAEVLTDGALPTGARALATSLLGYSEHPTADTVAALRALIGDDVDALSANAALALGNVTSKLDEAQASEQLDYLLDGLEHASGRGQRRRYVAALGNTESPRALDALVEQLDSPDPAVRRDAVLALGLIGTAEAGEIVARVMHGDPVSAVRRAAVDSAASRSFEAMFAALAQCLGGDADGAVRLAALNAIGAHAQTSQPALAAISAAADNDTDPAVRAQAAQYLR